MSKPKVLIYAPREEPKEILAALENAGLEIAYGDRAWQLPRGEHESAFAAAARDAVALQGTSIRHTPISRRIMETSQRLRIIAKYTVGVDDVDVEAATDLGILVCHAPTEANCFGVAEQTIAFMLAILKKIRERDADVRAGKWRSPEHATTFLGRRLSDGHPGITVGLVGLGRIGTRVAQLLAPWRVRILAYDPYIPPANFLLAGAEPVDYQTLLRESDVVSFHVVLTRETRHMLSEREIALMKPSAVVINTARGKVIDEAALARALANDRLRAAALDAFEEEPPAADSPLRVLGNKVLMSPHAASFNEGGELRPGIAWATRSVLSALAGRLPDNIYNREVIPRWQERFGGSPVGARRHFDAAPNIPNDSLTIDMQMNHCCTAVYTLVHRTIIPIFGSDQQGILPCVQEDNPMFLSHLISAFRQWRRYNESLRELNRLGDRELADIGITRADIPRVAWENSERC